MIKAMVLAAGYGSRLGSVTQQTPKCLVDIGGKSMLERVIDRLKGIGVESVVINLHHLADQVRNFVRSHDNFGIEVQFSFEPQILGTGGGVKAARELLGGCEEIVVHNADILSSIDLQAMIDARRSSGADAVLAVMRRPTPRGLLFDSSSRLVGWDNQEKGTKTVIAGGVPEGRYGFSGIQTFTPKVFSAFDNLDEAFSIISAYLVASEHGLRVCPYIAEGVEWLDIGTPERLSEARKIFGR